MKKPFLLAVIVCLALFTSCEKQGVPHTGDLTGNIYGIWQLTQKSEAIQTSEGVDKKDYDYTKVHFYLALAEFPIPHAIAKKGSFTDLDLDDVDVDGSTFTFNAEDNTFSCNIMGLPLNGNYKVGTGEKTVTMTFGRTLKYLSMTGTLESVSGGFKMLFPANKLLSFLKKCASVAGQKNSEIAAIASLADGYDTFKIGFTLIKQ